jgi:hypothetical protein
MKQCIYSPILRRLLFCILFTSLVSYQFLSSISQAGWFSSEKTPEEIAKEYGDAVVLIAALDKDGLPLTPARLQRG